MQMLIIGVLLGWMIWGDREKALKDKTPDCSGNPSSPQWLSPEQRTIIKTRWPLMVLGTAMMVAGGFFFGNVLFHYMQQQGWLPISNRDTPFLGRLLESVMPFLLGFFVTGVVLNVLGVAIKCLVGKLKKDKA